LSFSVVISKFFFRWLYADIGGRRGDALVYFSDLTGKVFNLSTCDLIRKRKRGRATY
jgi:hypothetical protein